MDLDLYGIAVDVWSATLGMSLEVDEARDKHLCEYSFRTGCISILGRDKLALFLDCSEPLAKRIGARMYGESEEDISEDDLEDALGEMSNILAGACEPHLDGATHIGLPVVSNGRQQRLRIPNSMILKDEYLQSDGLPVRISVIGIKR